MTLVAILSSILTKERRHQAPLLVHSNDLASSSGQRVRDGTQVTKNKMLSEIE